MISPEKMEFDHGEIGIYYLFVTSSLALTSAAHTLLEYVNYPFHTAANNYSWPPKELQRDPN